MAIGAGSYAAIGSAGATPPTKVITVSFSSSGTGSSAGWAKPVKSGKATSTFALTVGADPSAGAQVILNNVQAALPPEPTFTTDNYNAGSPRWYIQLASGAYLFGYPSISGLNTPPDTFAWSVNSCPSVDPNTYYSYVDALAAISSQCGTGDTVSGVLVVADSDQTYYANPRITSATDTITDLQYNGVTTFK
ncbi:MAG TPA: hypothetical protein VG368_03945 [Acidimicrobiales bacterium]|nr:hypothetical protein [Acidimicrobiales bacterium]